MDSEDRDTRVEILRRLQKLLWSLPEDEVAEIAQLLANDFVDKLDLMERARIDAAIESRLKRVVGPAAARMAREWLAQLRGN